MNEPAKYCKRLIEVDLPIGVISAHARREKSSHHGHISTLHIWWARRPLAACRAVLCAALWPDPDDSLCPPLFLTTARAALAAWATNNLARVSQASYQFFNRISRDRSLLEDATVLREALLRFIADFSDPSSSQDIEYLALARSLTELAHAGLSGDDSARPFVADPFAGGGSIPLEALRVGADAWGADLNPIAVLLNKVILEYLPAFGESIADDIARAGAWIGTRAEAELGPLYGNAGDALVYLWARTVRCEGPGCGADVPLIRNMQITRAGASWHYEWDCRPDLTVNVSLKHGGTAVSKPSAVQGKLVCPRPACGFTTSSKAVRAQLETKNGGASTARLLSVYSTGTAGRTFRAPTVDDVRAVSAAAAAAATISIPDDAINSTRPYKNTRGLSAVTRIGIRRFGDLYTPRQAVAIRKYQELIARVPRDGMSAERFRAVTTLLECAASRLIFQNCSLSRWNAARSTVEGAFGKQALQVVWDFAEVNPTSTGPASWVGAIEWLRKIVEAHQSITTPGSAALARAQYQVLPDDSVDALVTDPPYFAAIPYADLSNVFYVWERDFLREVHPDLYTPGLVRQDDEIIVTEANKGPAGEQKSPAFYQREMTRALEVGRRIVKPTGIAVVVFADTSTISWETILSAIIDSGWVITASWPIDTELQSRTQAEGSASLQSSIHIVCRPREHSSRTLRGSEVGDWRTVLHALPEKIHEWMPRLAAEGVVGADAIFACLGPALEVFSRYSRVEKASGEAVTLKEYLEHVWAAVSREAISVIFQSADTSGLDPDARLTAMWLWTLVAPATSAGEDALAVGDTEADDVEIDSTSTSKQGFVLEFDAARKIAQGLGANLAALSHLVEVKGDKARLLSAAERSGYLFGATSSSQQISARKRGKRKQLALFEEVVAEAEQENWGDLGAPRAGTTTLDRIHQAMLLFGTGRSEALKRFLVEEGVGHQAPFWKLAQALSALYPVGTDEKRWVDGVLARKKALGFA